MKNINILEFEDITVLIDLKEGRLTSLSLELLGKGRALADKVSKKLIAVVIGHSIKEIVNELKLYNIDEIYSYDNKKLESFLLEPYSAVLTDFIERVKPSTILISDNDYGKTIASKIAAAFNTGLTSGCTELDIKENLDLIQIKPIGEDLLVEMLCEGNRPQVATVKKSVMDPIEKIVLKPVRIIECNTENLNLNSRVKILNKVKREITVPIEQAEVLVVAGQGVKSKEDLNLIREFAKRINGELAVTRPLVQLGWADHKLQVGISGKTVKPSLIITVGVSGAIQFVVGMDKSKNIIAINTDKDAPIFKIANYALVGDLYEILPELIESIESK